MGRNQARGNRGNTAGQHDFAMIPRAEIPRSVFNRSCSLKTAFDSGYLIPVFVDEALPGDTMNLSGSSFCRMATPIVPLMDNFYLDWFWFAVPYRLVWSNFEKFNGAQANPGDSTDFELPRMTAHEVALSSLSDYMGIPIDTGAGMSALDYVSLWHRAYNLIWNEWFRDENLQDSVVVDMDDGPDDIADYVLLRRGKRHDYFTSCLPFPQKGDPVSLPLGTSAPIIVTSDPLISGIGQPTFAGAGTGTAALRMTNAVATTSWSVTPIATDNVSWVNPNLELSQAAITAAAMRADLSAATAATINDIRQAFQIQRLLERDARGGTRYTEIVRSHFGVVSPDARLQRPEFLGGCSTRINVHPVARTSGSAGDLTSLTAALGAFATTSTERCGFVKSFTEHCLIIGLVSARADLTYQQGIERMFERRTRFEMYWPALSHLGEQAVINREIFATGVGDPVAGTGDYATFGYQERYAEYRYKPSRTSSVMRSTAPAPIDTWHLGQEFASLPVLNDVFIQEDPPVDRVIATPSQPHLFGDFWFEFRHARPMPTFSVPGLIDHF